ncbi:MAG TPA: hypothetical protein VEJ63_22785 [Planctomycetota bacterium]|nr:hypothetical protein [Planctomycetota bacterium]
MGLGIQITAPLPQDFSIKRLVNSLMFSFHSGLDEILKPGIFVAPQEQARQCLFYLYPAEEPLYANWDDTTLTISARTNGAGPGYHAWLVERLETAEEKLGVKWNWLNNNGDPGDETGYHEHRDFERLRAEMSRWLRVTAGKLVNMSDEASNIAISMPLEGSIVGGHFASSPMGFWDRDFFEQIVVARGAEIAASLAEQFFPWWHREQDARFYKSLGLVHLWCNVPWRSPDTDEELETMKLALKCFDKAKALDMSVSVPEEEIAELKRIVATAKADMPDVAPDPKRIGFKRHEAFIQLPGRWRIKIPGYFHSKYDPEKGTLTFWFGTRTIHLNAYGVEKYYPTLRDVLNWSEPEQGDTTEFAKDHLLGRARLQHKKDGTMYGYWMLSGSMVMMDSVAVFTICFDNRDDYEWANVTWQTLYRPPQK